ncbi:MAG: metallopeptidase TldD-related protein [Nannocystaceae bacterium]
MSLSRTAAKRIADHVLAAAKLDEVTVECTASQDGNTRFANNEPTTTGDVARLGISVTATQYGRSATVSGNRSDKAALEALVQQAEEMAQLAPVDPEHVPLLGRQQYARVVARDRATTRLGGKERAVAVAEVLAVGDAKGLRTAGLVSHADRAYAIANKAGLFAYHASTSASLSTTFRTGDGTGSGRASSVSYRYSDLDAGGTAAVAARKAELSRNPQELAPGRYTVILEAQAVADLLGFMMWSLSTRSADEGRSYFARPAGGNRIGEKLFHDRVTIKSDPSDKAHPASPVGRGGLPLGPQTWIESGVLRSLTCGRYWAQKTGVAAVPYPSSIHMSGTDRSVDDLIAGADNAVLVTRFWYNRMVDPRSILVTGLTRDGTFHIRGGKISKSVKNFRYNESPVTLLKNVVALGKPQRVEGRFVTVVPPMVVHGFNFSSTSDAV